MFKSRIFWFHIVSWSLIYLYILGGYVFALTNSTYALLSVSITFVQMIQFYICYRWVFPKFYRSKNWFLLIAGLFFALIIFVFLRYIIEEVFYLYLFDVSNYGPSASLKHYFVDNLYFGCSFILIAGGVYSVEQNYTSQLLNAQLKEEMKKSELAFLKSQINPHFLYNTLNYIYSQALPVSEKMAVSVLKLSDLMRYTLDESKHDVVPLEKEVSYLESYISLYKMRFDKEFNLDLKIEGVNDQQFIAPLLLIPFVENAFKHGVTHDVLRPVKIQLVIRNSRMQFEISNKINHGPKDQSSGIGLTNVRRRLDLLYPDRYELLIANNGNTYKSTLVIHLK